MVSNRRTHICLLTVFSAAALLVSGCASLRDGGNRQMTWRSQSPDSTAGHSGIAAAGYRTQAADCADAEPQTEYGRPNSFIDGVGWFFGIPGKVLLWDRRMENHDVSPQTVAVVEQYLQDNGMHDVKVRVNQYAPGGEWKRLTQNKGVSPGWRYTFGALRTVGYTLFPGRLFGEDNYNPYTNTVSIYSDIPTVAVHEAAYAVDNSHHKYRGTYGFGQGIAGLNIWHETVATRLASNWLEGSGSPSLMAENNRVMPPLYGVRVGGSLGELVPTVEPLLTITGAVAGHAVAYRQKPTSSAANAAVQNEMPAVVPAGYEQ